MEFKDIKVGMVLKLAGEMPFFYLDHEQEGKTLMVPAGTEVDVIALCDTDENRNTATLWRFVVVSYVDEDLDTEPYTLIADWMLEEVE